MGESNFTESDRKIVYVKDEITGIKVQYLKVVFSNSLEDDVFRVYVNSEEIDFNKKIISDDGEIQIEVAIPKDCKQLYITCNNDESIERIYTLDISLVFKFKITLLKLVSIIRRSIIVFGRGMRFLWREHHMIIPPSLWKKYFLRFFMRVKERGEILWNPFIQDDYHKWINIFENDEHIEVFEYNPLMSILIPVYNVEKKYLVECLESILNQTYQNFEVCLVDDCSTNEETIETIKE